MIQNKYLRQPNWLYRQYYEHGLSTIQIAELCSCGRDTVCRQMEGFGIPRRTFEEARSFRFLGRKYRKKTWLYRKYWIQSYGLKRLADLCNVSKTTILSWLRKHNIRTRNPLEAYHLQWKTPNKSHGSLTIFNKILLIIRDMVESFKWHFSRRNNEQTM